MNILILGGTKFIGRHIAESLLAAGHRITILTRGKTQDDLPAAVERVIGDRDAGVAGLSHLKGRTFDACIDVSGYTPLQVRASAEALHNAVSQYLFISTGAVYRASKEVPIVETHPLLEAAAENVIEINGETYGPLKVTCEQIVREIFGVRGKVVRPQIVAGPHDPYGRYSRWLKRAMQSGVQADGTIARMLGPGDGTDYVQVVDVRDVSRLVQLIIEGNLPGVFNAAGPRITWREFLHVLGSVNVVWVGASILQQHNITEQQLPLYRKTGGTRSEGMHISPAASVAAGVVLTTPKETARSVREWIAQDTCIPVLSLADEEALIRAALQG